MEKKPTKLYNRIKVGRPARFESAEQLWKEALEYFQFCDDNPMQLSLRDKKKASSRGEKNAEKLTEEVPRPYTLDGLCVYLNLQTEWSIFKANQKKREDWDELNRVIQACEQCIRNQQVGGAMIGLYNANLTARLNGITEKIEQNVETKTTMSWEELKAKMNESRKDEE